MKLINYPQLGEQLFSDVLPSGLNVFVVPKPGYHKKYAFFATDYGGVDRRFKLTDNWVDTPAGVAHFLEHKMFDTKDGNALEILSANGASPNAYTSNDSTAYHFECIDMFMENLETLLSFVSVPYFTDESVEKEQGIITQEIRMVEDNPDFNLYYGLLRSLFKNNPVRDPVAGTIESIKKITAETLYDCHKVFYAPSNMVLCVVGDVDPAEVCSLASKILPGQPVVAPHKDYGTLEEHKPEDLVVQKAMEVSLPIFLAGCKIKPVIRGPESLLYEIVGSLALEIIFGHSSPFFLRLYSKGLVNVDFSASFDSAAGVAYTMFGGETREPLRVFNEVTDEIGRLLKDGPDTALFDRIKKAAIGGHIRALNSFGIIASSISEGHFRDFDSYKAPEILTKVSIDDIMNFIRENLIPDNMAISIINPIDEVMN